MVEEPRLTELGLRATPVARYVKGKTWRVPRSPVHFED
jgi:hypothetical protein